MKWKLATRLKRLAFAFIVISTIATAQGGGGSFENKKPIGEVFCCEPRMAERIHFRITDGPEGVLEWLQGYTGQLVGHLTHSCWM